MFFILTKKAFKEQKLLELKRGGDLDLIILDMMDFQIMDKENKETPPFLVKQEYQALLELPYQQKFIAVLQMLGYKHIKLLENVK